MIIVVLVWGIAFEGAYLFSCGTHVNAWWGSVENNMKYCPGGLKVEYGFALSDFITDAIILITPIPLV